MLWQSKELTENSKRVALKFKYYGIESANFEDWKSWYLLNKTNNIILRTSKNIYKSSLEVDKLIWKLEIADNFSRVETVHYFHAAVITL